MNGQGKYKTKQRDLILGYIERNKDKHLTADGIADYMKNQEKPVSRSTVYRYLDVLVNEGHVRKYVIEEGKCCCYQYISKENTCSNHYHFKCSRCMKLFHMDCEMLDKIYATLKLISQLQSTSIFIELDADNGAEDIIDENVLMNKRDELIDEFAAFLTGKTKQFNRAVMWVVLSSLPVFFNSLNEVTEYVENSLFGCSDEAEKRAVEEIIKNIIFE